MYITTKGCSNARTNDDTLYALTIPNVQKFQANGSTFLSFELGIDSYFYEYGLNPNISINLNEIRFLETIEGLDLGLTLYKGDINDFNNWSQLKQKNDGFINEKNCN